MKILYISPDRSDTPPSQAPSAAGGGVDLRSATGLGEAAHWIFSNLDLAALILDAEFGLPQCASFLENLRGRGLSVPLILMASEEAGWMEALSLRADDCILQKDLLLSDLEGTVRRAVHRARPSVAFAELARHVVELHRQLEHIDREHDLRIEIGDLKAAHTALQEQLARTETALHQSAARHTEASQRTERREEELLCLLREEAEKRTTIAHLLQDEQRARNEVDEALKRERLTTTEQIARREEFDAQLQQARIRHTALEGRLASAEVERRDLERRHASESAAEQSQFAKLEARLITELGNAITIKDTLDRQIAEHQAARESLQEELDSKNAMLERLEQRERELQALLTGATNSRDALVHELAIGESSLRAAEQREREQRIAALKDQTQLEARVAEEQNRRAALERELQELRSAAAEARHRLLERIDAVAAERRQEVTALADQFAQERSDYHGSLNTLQEQVRQLELERDTVSNNFRTHSKASEEVARRFADEREALQRALELAARELVSTRTERDGLRANADQVRQLQSQLDEILQRVDREFDDYPLAVCRATRAGVITRANRAFGALLGCPSADAKRRLDLASEWFDSSNEMVWLVERSASSEDASSVECTRRKINGSRLMLRLRAMPGPDAIHIVIEDLTPNWMLQEKLNRAQQMDAVGRLAAEVALTCVSFLRDATEHGCRLIAMLEDGSEAQRSGERMIGEVDRVATSLRQLAEYADDQAMSLDPVDLHQVLHDLEPILQKLAGDDIQVVLPERPPQEEPPFNVDVTAQRVERLLINLAHYGRGRTPSGGRMVFDVASTTVDRPFVAKYPNVRQGPHVLLTMTHARGGNGLVPSREAEASTAEGNESGTSVSGTPGIDLSALHGLVRHCGGHLWMDTDTTGEMKIQIHLPLRAA